MNSFEWQRHSDDYSSHNIAKDKERKIKSLLYQTDKRLIKTLVTVDTKILYLDTKSFNKCQK